jgi:hypothetical protein
MDEDGGMLRKVKLRGMDKVGWLSTFTWSRRQPLAIAKPNGPSMTQRRRHSPTDRIARDLNRFCVEPMNVKSRVRRTRNLNFQQAARPLGTKPEHEAAQKVIFTLKYSPA